MPISARPQASSPTLFQLSTSSPTSRAWVGVVSHAHVERGTAGGFAQLCHGKRHALARMQLGDTLVYYSPSSRMGENDGFRSFTALGEIVGQDCYPFDMGGGFVPFRRDVSYIESKRVVPVTELASRLHFIQNTPNWGMLARRGHFEIDLHDADLIRRALLGHRE